MRVVLWLFFGWVARFDILVFGWTKIQPRENGPKMLSILVLDIATSFFFFLNRHPLISSCLVVALLCVYIWILNNVSKILKLKRKKILYTQIIIFIILHLSTTNFERLCNIVKIFCQFKGK